MVVDFMVLLRSIDLYVTHRYEAQVLWQWLRMFESSFQKPLLTKSALLQMFPLFDYEWALQVGVLRKCGDYLVVDKTGFIPLTWEQMEELYGNDN